MIKERDWTDRPLAAGEVIEAGGLTIRHAPPLPACLISCDLAAAIDALAPGAPSVGLLEDRPDVASLRIARDRALLIGVTAEAGWQNGSAISPATGLYTCLEIAGSDLMEALAEGTNIDLSLPSPSAALQFAGITCLLTRRADMVELWVEAAMTRYVTTWLTSRVSP